MRRFGIELEMVAPEAMARTGGPLNAAKSVLQDAGIMSRTNTHYGRNYSEWQVKPDGSIQPYDRGAEVVSRILPALESSYDEVHRAVSALNNAGFGINRTCGFHVHVSVADLSMPVRQLVLLRYAQIQNQINCTVPPSRRNNNFCQPLSADQQRQLASYIDSGSNSLPQVGRYCVTNMAWLSQGDNSRIEFRQAAGTCNASKVVGWVRFLQDMITEVARRAAEPGVRFGTAGAPRPVAPVAPVAPVRPVGNVPRMRPGSDAYRTLEQIRTTGVVTTAWAENHGIADNVFRRIITGFRRHGADLHTIRAADAGPTYVLNGARNLPMTAEQVFAAPMPASVAAAPAPAPAPVPQVTRAASFVGYPFESGMSMQTQAWINERLEDGAVGGSSGLSQESLTWLRGRSQGQHDNNTVAA